jgi:hypothetical protein
MAGILGQLTGNLYNDSSALSYLNSTAAVDVVGVFDSNFNQLFSNVRPMTAKINEHATFPKHPLESGASFSEHRIIEPIEITLNVIFNGETYVDDYATVKSYYLGVTSMTVQTRTGVYPNMFIEQMPHEETAQTYDTITMSLQLREVQIVQSKTVSVTQNANDSATISKGNQQGTTQTAPTGNSSGTTGSAVYGWFGGGAVGN